MAAPLPEPRSAGAARHRLPGSFAGEQREVAHCPGGLVNVGRRKHNLDAPAHVVQVKVPQREVFPQQVQQSLPVGLAGD